jgi:hypothetical protein
MRLMCVRASGRTRNSLHCLYCSESVHATGVAPPSSRRRQVAYLSALRLVMAEHHSGTMVVGFFTGKKCHAAPGSGGVATVR